MEQKQSTFTMVTPLPQEMVGILTRIILHRAGMLEMEIIPSSSLMTLKEIALMKKNGIKQLMPLEQ